MRRRNPSSAASALWALAALAGLAACQPPPVPGLSVTTAHYPLEGPCPTTAGGDEFSAEIDSLTVKIRGPGMDDMEASGSVGAVTVEDVPVGDDREIILYGDSGSSRLWRGITQGVSVVENEDTPVDVMLSKIADLTCPRSPHSASRSFHTATLLSDGRVLLVGGAAANQDATATCPGCRRLTATGSIDLYDPTTGVFTALATLSAPRMFHTASVLADGRVLVVGGSFEVLTVPPDATTPFPVKPLDTVGDVEVIDPESGTVTTIAADAAYARVFHAATTMNNGDVMISGGIPASSAIHNLGNALDSTILCSLFSDNVVCTGASAMTRRRAGHALYTLTNSEEDTGLVIAWGGAVSAGVDDGYETYAIEVFDPSTNVWTARNVAAMSNNRNLFFAATSHYVGFRILAAGGLTRASDGTFDFARLTVGSVSRGPVLVLDTVAETWGIATGSPGLDPMHIDAPRFLGSAANLYGQKRAMIAGGFTTMEMRPSQSLDFFDEEDLDVVTLSVGGATVELREGRGGLVATNLGNGAILLSGGQTGENGTQAPLMTSEIYTDIVDPAGD